MTARDLRNIPDQDTILNNCKIRKIDTRKCIVTLCMLFLCTCSDNYLSVKYKVDPLGIIIRRINKAVQQICLRICHIHIDRLLRSCNNNRLG